MSSTDSALDRSTPAALRSTWLAAIRTGDAERLRPLLTPDYELWAHAAAPLQGADAAVEAMQRALDHYRIEQSFDVVETVISGGWAFERGIEHMNVTPAAGGAARSMMQRVVLILRRDADGQWEYARGITNGLPADPPTH